LFDCFIIINIIIIIIIIIQRVVGNRVFILTNGGGQGVQLCDALGRFGLTLAKAKTENFAHLKLPSFFIVSNPMDLVLLIFFFYFKFIIFFFFVVCYF
jgi:hypothetical protein